MLALALAGAAVPAPAQPTVAANAPATAAERLSVQRIFASPDFRLRFLPAVQWMADGQRYTFVQPNEQTRATDLVVEDARSGARRVLVEGARLVPPGATQPIEIEGYDWNAGETRLLIFTNTQPVWRYNTKGTYYVYDLQAQRLTPVSTRPGWQMFAKFSPDGGKVGFVRENNLFVTDLASGAETQLTHDGSATIVNGTTDWVYEEELDLRDAWRWSPDGRHIAFWRFDQSPIQSFTMLRETDSVYSRPITLPYPKAGEPNSLVKIGVVELAGGRTVWMDTGENPDVYLARMDWAASPNELLIQRMNRHQNRVDLLLTDAASGRSRVLFSETDSAWVDVDDDLTWLGSGRQFLWTSERDGHNHVYLYHRDGRLARQLTRGAWDVTRLVGIDERGGWLYFTSTEEGPEERQLYRVRLDGGGFRQVSSEPGTHAVQMSPAGGFYIDVYSRLGVPPVTRLHTADGQVVRTLVENERVAQNLRTAGAAMPEPFSFRTRDGVTLNGWMMKPAGFDAQKKYPVLMYVYGGPGSMTTQDAWGGSRQLWHQLLAQEGYLVVSIDNRGTGGRGRDFKKATYLNLGKWESHDQIEGARHLASLPFVDASRIGIWGWSYGGYMTLMSLLQGGDLFKAGVSVAPVTDWRLYDNIYTERFMRTPRENAEGYTQGAPVALADRLQSRLLLVHGTLDDNVHFQNSTQMVAALQKAGKQFDFMMYPDRNHSISGGTTSVHLYTLMTQWLKENL